MSKTKKNTDSLGNDNQRKLKIKFSMLFPIWRMMRKAKKIGRKNFKNPGYYSEEYAYNFAQASTKKILKATGVNITVKGYENWLDRGVVLVSNHQSNFDPIILFALNNFYLNQPLAFIAKQELWNDKKLGRFVKIIDAIPLDRENPRSALEAFKEAKELIVNYKRSLAIFPEGTRSKSSEMLEFHSAALKVAQMANAPVVPVTIIDSYKIFEKNKPKNLEVKVIFGKPILPARHISLKTEDLTKNVKRIIAENMEKYKNETLVVTQKMISKINEKTSENIKEYLSEKPKVKPKKDKKKFKDLLKVVD